MRMRSSLKLIGRGLRTFIYIPRQQCQRQNKKIKTTFVVLSHVKLFLYRVNIYGEVVLKCV